MADPIEIRSGTDNKPVIGDVAGIPYVHIGHNSLDSTFTAYSGTQASASLIAAPASTVALYVTDFLCTGDTATTFTFDEGLTTTGNKWRAFLPSGGGTFGYQFRNPIKLTTATALGITTDATTTSVTISFFTAS